MTADADPFRPRLQFGPRATNDRALRRIVLLSVRLAMMVALLTLFARSAFDFSRSDGSHGQGRDVQGTALVEPRDERPKLPQGMILASTSTADRNPEPSRCCRGAIGLRIPRRESLPPSRPAKASIAPFSACPCSG